MTSDPASTLAEVLLGALHDLRHAQRDTVCFYDETERQRCGWYADSGDRERVDAIVVALETYGFGHREASP